jgi:hypothetical protein
MAVRRWAGAALFMLALVDAAPALATHQRLVTIAARVCPSYEAITANRARNNIQESLRDLGADTPYGTRLPDGRVIPSVVSPAIEAEFQPLCSPLQGWRFKLGRGIGGTDEGVWGALSRVSGPYALPDISTKSSVPLRDEFGHPIGAGVRLEGAETIHLTHDQVEQATSRDKLWIQGGVPGAPITGDQDAYAFGALRCATDILNGDNVEWIGYPEGGVDHVFCFAYYVSPAPTSGTIVVEKRIVGPDGTPPQTVRFTGNISYETTPDGTGFFDLTASLSNPGSMSFIRAAGSNWYFEEQVPPGWTLDPPTCVSAGASSTYTVAGSRVTVALAAGDTMHCTFVNRYSPPVSGLLIRKVTRGALGTFRFSVDGGPFDIKAKTLSEGAAYEAVPELTDLEPGRHTITEQIPQSDAGEWSRESVFCGPRARGAAPVVVVVIPAGAGHVCTFTNRFTHAGAIRITKRTLNADATTRFQIRPLDDPEVEFEQIAETTADGPPVVAEGDRTTAIPLGDYAIQETTSSVDGRDGLWRVASIVCDRIPVWSEQGRIVIRLTAADPRANCAFTNELVRRDPPPEPPEPEPPGPPVPPGPVPDPSEGGIAGETAESDPAELRVTKTASPRRITLGEVARYRVVVRNLGPGPARQVTVVERTRASRGVILSARTSQGRCFERPPRHCSLGRLRAGARAEVTVRARPDRLGRIRNVVAVNTGTRQRTRRGKVAIADVVVVPPLLPRFTG